jgi:hypothetical protein
VFPTQATVERADPGEASVADASTGASWTSTEPGFLAMRTELVRLFRRAGRRPAIVFALALLLTLAVVFLAYRARRPYRARISVRMTEVVDAQRQRIAWTERELRAYVNAVSLTNVLLLEVYEKFLWDKRKPLDRGRALERLRDAVDVSVIESATVADVQERSGARSAHVLIAFEAPTAAQALGVVRALAQPVVATSQRRRREEAAQATAAARIAAKEANLSLAALTKDAVAQMGALGSVSSRVSPMDLTGLAKAIQRARERQALLDAEALEAERRERAETHRSGIDFEIAGELLDEPLPLLPLLGLVGLCGFLLLSPVAAMLVGAFDRHIEVLDDLTRLGLPALGTLRESGLPESDFEFGSDAERAR